MSVSWNHAVTMGHANNWEVDIFAYAHLDIQVKMVKQVEELTCLHALNMSKGEGAKHLGAKSIV